MSRWTVAWPSSCSVVRFWMLVFWGRGCWVFISAGGLSPGAASRGALAVASASGVLLPWLLYWAQRLSN